MRLFDFSAEGAAERWYAINDGVMGGVSRGALRSTAAGTAEFRGRVSLENEGGFASVRSRDELPELGRVSGLELRVRGDGRLYKINLKLDRSTDGILYRAPVPTRAGEWQTLRLPFAAFEPSWRGRVVPGSPPLDPSRVRSVGLMISERQSGPFRLEIAWIGAYVEGP